MFSGILILEPQRKFCMGYSICVMANLQNGLISSIVSVFCSNFFDRTSLNDLSNGF